MSAGSVLALLACLAAAFGLEQLVVRMVRAVLQASAPLSGDQADSFTYDRLPWTFGERDLAWLWLALAAAAAAGWSAFHFQQYLLLLPAILAWGAALAWDLWSWERVAASVKLVSWRRGWRQSVRQVPISRLADVTVHEKPGRGPAGVCRLVLMLDDGKVVKLPRCSSWGGLGRAEDVANFIRLQMQQVQDMRRRASNDRRRGRPAVDPVERELRAKLKALREGRTASADTAPQDLG